MKRATTGSPVFCWIDAERKRFDAGRIRLYNACMAESSTGGGVGFWTVLTGWTGWAARVKLPPSGDRWLRANRWLRALCSHPLPSGGGMRGRPPPSGDRWLRAAGGYGLFVAIRCQAVGGCELSLHRLATGGYGRTVVTGRFFTASESEGNTFQTETSRFRSDQIPSLGYRNHPLQRCVVIQLSL